MTGEKRTHGSDETANVVDRCHCTLGICRWVVEGCEEVGGDDHVAEDALVVAWIRG